MAKGDGAQATHRGRGTLSSRAIGDVIPEGARVLLDTSALIAYLDEPGETTPVASAVIDGCVRSGRNPAVVSTVTAMELLVRPMRLGDHRGRGRLVEFLVHFPNLRVHDITFATAHEAAALRAAYRLGAADALIVASGLVAGATDFVSNDRGWVAKLAPISDRVRVRYLEDFAA
ncbi:MAG: type II toxin-antitoxin system VapC family toxin [Chloroflexota bacterium]